MSPTRRPGSPSRCREASRANCPSPRPSTGRATVTRSASTVGGGTPTYLDEAGLDAVFDVAGRVMGADPAAVLSGVEPSPDTLAPGKVAVLRGRGVDRVSVGMQSFVKTEARASGRSQSRSEVDAALAVPHLHRGGRGRPVAAARTGPSARRSRPPPGWWPAVTS